MNLSPKYVICTSMFWAGLALVFWQTNWIVALAIFMIVVGIVAYNDNK